MRRIWTSSDRTVIDHFCQELSRHEIPYSVDTEKDLDWGSETYGTVFYSIWTHEDSDMERAKALFAQATGMPEETPFAIPNASANSPLQQFLRENFHVSFNQKPMRHLPSRYVTLGIIFLCSLLFCIDSGNKNYSLPPSYARSYAPSALFQNLLFDYPQAEELENKLIDSYGIESLDLSFKLDSEGTVLRNKFLKTPYWGGFYTEAVTRLSKRDHIPTPSLSPSLLGERIREGEVWRLFTPCLLHANIFHIVFNLLWIIALGSQIERKISPLRYLLLIVIIAVLSNTAQYLMTGPSFVGISGVICGMIGFIAARQKTAPWEAYDMSQRLYSSLLFFIWVMVILGGTAFFLESYLRYRFPISFANTAHLSGLAVGFVLGKMQWFRLTRLTATERTKAAST